MFDATQRFSTRLSGLLSHVVNAEWGLIRAIYEERHRFTGIHVVSAALTSPGYFRDNRPLDVPTADSGTGASPDAEAAYWGALGEAFERYCASIYHRHLMPVGRASDIANAIDLARHIRGGAPRTVSYDPQASRRWVCGRSLADGSLAHLPAQMIYLSYQAENPAETIEQGDSTGLACGQSFEDAAFKGLCERLERDAFAANWLLGRQPPRIVFSSQGLSAFSTPVAAILSGTAGVSIELFHLAACYGVYVVMACLTTPEGIGLTSAASSPSLRAAVEKATVEAIQGVIAIDRIPDRPRPDVAGRIQSTIDHALYYLDPERFRIVAEICNGEVTTTLDDIEAPGGAPLDLRQVVAALNDDGLTAYAVDLTTPDVASLGLYVVRTVVPGLQPLIFSDACLNVPDERRLNEWRRIWRLPTGPLNPHPHPFP